MPPLRSLRFGACSHCSLRLGVCALRRSCDICDLQWSHTHGLHSRSSSTLRARSSSLFCCQSRSGTRYWATCFFARFS
jgi:hypothetical protein